MSRKGPLVVGRGWQKQSRRRRSRGRVERFRENVGAMRVGLGLVETWPPGEMASRLTTNQEIAGSTPAVVISKEALTEVRHFYVTNFKKKDPKGCLFGLFFLVGQHKENRYFESILRGLGTNCK